MSNSTSHQKLTREQEFAEIVNNAVRSVAGATNTTRVLRPRGKAVSSVAASLPKATVSKKSVRRPRKAPGSTKSRGGAAKATVSSRSLASSGKGRAASATRTKSATATTRTTTVPKSKRTAVTKAVQKSRGASAKAPSRVARSTGSARAPKKSSRKSSTVPKKIASSSRPTVPKTTVPPPIVHHPAVPLPTVPQNNIALPTVPLPTGSQATVPLTTVTLENLPLVALERVFSFLRINGNCGDLASLRQVSRVIYRGVESFLSRTKNRVQYRKIRIQRDGRALRVLVYAHSGNVGFHGWSEIDKTLFGIHECAIKGGTQIGLSSIVSDGQGRRDANITQLRDALAGHHARVRFVGLEAGDFQIVSDLLKEAKVDLLLFKKLPALDDAVGNNILALVHAAKSLRCHVETACATLTDPRSFLDRLEGQLSRIRLSETGRPTDDLFGIEKNIWEEKIGEKLQRGFLIRVDNVALAATNPPSRVDLYRSRLNSIEWWSR